MTYELVFTGAALSRDVPRYKRQHATLASAKHEAARVLEYIENTPAWGNHTAIVYGPELNPDGLVLGNRRVDD